MSAALAFSLALAGAVGLNLGPGASPAAAVPMPSISLNDVGWNVAAAYKGIAVTAQFTNIPDDATQIRVTVHRTKGGDVVKLSKPGAAFFDELKEVGSGGATAPIYIQTGNRAESDSSSWLPAENGVWAWDTMPTSVTVELLAGDTVVASANQPNIHTVYAKSEDVMPAGIVVDDFGWVVDTGYTGVAVTSEFKNVPAEATAVRVKLHRTTGGDVVKQSRPDAKFFTNMKAAKAARVTTPFMIQFTGYDESSSGSWQPALNGVWTWETVPTSATVELLAGDTVIASGFTSSLHSVYAKAEDVMPAGPPVMTIPDDATSVEIEIPADTPDVRLDLGAPSGPENSIVLPVPVTVTSPAGATVVLPENVKITSSDASWDGQIQLPKVKNDVVVPTADGEKATVALALELGSPTARITFDAPVKLVLAGQAGQRAAYIQFGEFHEIAEECPATAPAGLTTEECWINDGDDLVIWTTHFTTFVAYAVASSGLAATGSHDATLVAFAALGALVLGSLAVAGTRAVRARRAFEAR